MRRRQWVLVASAVSAAMLTSVALAWACRPEAAIQIFPKSGPVGTEVTVIGEAFMADTVELRWDSVTGELLGTAQGPKFKTRVTIPEATLGEHTILAFHTKSAQGQDVPTVLGFSRQQFLVTAAPSPQEAGNNEPPRQGSPREASERQPSPRQPDENAEQRTGSAVRRTAVESGRTVFAGSTSGRDGGASAASQGLTRPAPPSDRAALGDFFDGFTAGDAPSLDAGSATFGEDPSRTPLMFGMVLLGIGSLLVAGAFLFLVLGRRRAEARASRSQL